MALIRLRRTAASSMASREFLQRLQDRIDHGLLQQEDDAEQQQDGRQAAAQLAAGELAAPELAAEPAAGGGLQRAQRLQGGPSHEPAFGVRSASMLKRSRCIDASGRTGPLNRAPWNIGEFSMTGTRVAAELA